MDRLNKDVVHEICTNQVVVTLHACVKELVENSIDAASSRVEVRLRESGSELLEVVDNGRGVAAEDYERLAVRHATSKIREYDDLSKTLSTFGFRGEALAAIAAMGELTVCTRTASDENATLLTYDRFGRLVSRAPAARELGTTVSVRELFKRLPVRHREFMKNAKMQVAATLRLIQACAIVQPEIRFQVVAEKRGTAAGRATLLSTSGTARGWRQAAAAVLGDAVVADVETLEMSASGKTGWALSGFISTPSGGRRTRDAQLFFVNGRPIDPPKRIIRLINDTYHQYNSRMWPVVVLSFSAAQGLVDVNVTPDKRTVFMHNEESLLTELQQCLSRIYGPCTRQVVPSVSGPGLADFGIKRTSSGVLVEAVSLSSAAIAMDTAGDACDDVGSRTPASLTLARRCSAATAESFDTPEKLASSAAPAAPSTQTDRFDSMDVDMLGVSEPTAADADLASQVSWSSQLMPGVSVVEFEPAAEEAAQASQAWSQLIPGVSVLELDVPAEASEAATAASTIQFDEFGPFCLPAAQLTSPPTEEPTSFMESEFPYDMPTLPEAKLERTAPVQAAVAMSHLEAAVARRRIRATQRAAAGAAATAAPTVHFPGAFSLSSLRGGAGVGAAASLEEVAGFATSSGPDRASFSFDQSCFSQMRVIGQFNLGFIIAALHTKGSSVDGEAVDGGASGLQLFIFDQHASDEKVRFEGFNRESRIAQQPLVSPHHLQLTPAQEEIASSHLAIFRANGFEIRRDDTRPPGKRLRICSVPSIDTSAKAGTGVVFGETDVRDLLDVLEESEAAPRQHDASSGAGNGPAGLLDLNGHRSLWGASWMPRPKRVWQLLACRACRGAVMIGKALNVAQMERALSNLGSLEQPWNCPHGRPTMRHLSDASIAWQTPKRSPPLVARLKAASVAASA